MLIPLNEELKEICKQIIEQDKSIDEWAEIESDDLFQTKSFEGGYDATEKEFVFCYYADTVYWFQISLDQVHNIHNGEIQKIEGTRADN